MELLNNLVYIMFETTSTPDTTAQEEKGLNALLASIKTTPIEELSSTKAFLETVGGIVELQ